MSAEIVAMAAAVRAGRPCRYAPPTWTSTMARRTLDHQRLLFENDGHSSDQGVEGSPATRIHSRVRLAVFLLALVSATATVHAQVSPQPADPQATSAPTLWERSRMTGDWGGARTKLEDAGVKLDFEATAYYEGLLSGTGAKSFELGGRLDGFIKLDSGKLGLWPGGGFVTHLEYRGDNPPGSLGGTFFPTNAGMDFPSDAAHELVATSLYLTQKIGDRGSLLIGKINALDLLENDLFFGGWGTRRFVNTVSWRRPAGSCRRCSWAPSAAIAGMPLRYPFGSTTRPTARTTTRSTDCSTTG